MPLLVDIAWRQICGDRASQQDKAATISVDGSSHLLVLSDGMGGHAGGDIASDVVVRTFCHAWHDPHAPHEVSERLIFALQAANVAVYDRVIADAALDGMGATLVAAHVESDRLHWVSVGDSPIWMIREGKVARLNAAHSVGACLDRQVRDGKIGAEEAARSPERSHLLEAVTGNDIHLVDMPSEPFRLPPGSVLIIASDGVESCSLDELAELAGDSGENADELAANVLDAIESHGRPGQDNATLIVLRAGAVLEGGGASASEDDCEPPPWRPSAGGPAARRDRRPRQVRGASE